MPKLQDGGADRDRTGGLLVANQALSQLSYSPASIRATQRELCSLLRPRRRVAHIGAPHRLTQIILVGLGRVELPTSPLSGVRSSHLSYRPVVTGGAGRDRTGDLLNANQALSQLSYSPLNPEKTRSRAQPPEHSRILTPDS